ncbi:AraC family transcriptional regulator, partial [Lysobacter sp. 2RAB21]
MEAQGAPAQQVLRDADIDASRLAAPNGRIGAEEVRRIWDHALALTGDPLLGLKMAEVVNPSAFRVLGLAAMSCESLRACVELMLRYHRLVSESGTLTAQTHANGDVGIVYTEQLLRLRLLPQQVEAIVGGILSFARWLAGRRIVPAAV